MRKEKGITLVALIVTVVILIILAGVSLNLAFSDNGLIKKQNMQLINLKIVMKTHRKN